VTPISLGIFASANQSAAATSFESIATVTVGAGGASSIDFTSIPSTYTHLQIRGIDCGGTGSGYGYASIRLNSDTALNYSRHLLWGTGTAASAFGAINQSRAQIIRSSLTSSYFSASVTDILDYTNTNKYKTIRVLSGVDLNGDGSATFGSSVYMSTSAISSITLLPNNQFQQYTTFALYGIKVAA
jgi:hypothetical protein